MKCRWTAISEWLHFIPLQAPEKAQESRGMGVVKMTESHQNSTNCDGFWRADFLP